MVKTTLQPLLTCNTSVDAWPSLNTVMKENPDTGTGYLKAIVAVLTEIDGYYDAEGWGVKLKSSSSKREYRLSGDKKTWIIIYPKTYLLAIAALIDVHTLEKPSDLGTQLKEKWALFIANLKKFIGTQAPFNFQQLQKAAQNPHLNELCLNVSKQLHLYLTERLPEVDIIEKNAPYLPSTKPAPTLYDVLFNDNKLFMPPSLLVKDIIRAISRGTTAILCGPTGVGKTEAVKMAAMLTSSVLVKIAGHPGLDDRTLYGGTYPDGKGGFIYVEGPLTEAWRYAFEGKPTVLLIDELARMDPYYHAVLIGALDTYSGREIKARPKFLTHLDASRLEDNERYYALTLPNGAILVAPTKLLSIIATTNLGSNYTQITSTLDPALSRRFQLHFEVEEYDSQTKLTILEKITLIPKSIGEIMLSLEEFTHNHTAANGSLLTISLNLGVLINWAKETVYLMNEGVISSWEESLKKSLFVTVIPYVCPRLPSGKLEEAAVKMVRDELDLLIRVKLRETARR